MTHRLIQDGKLVLYGPVGMVDFFSDEGFGANEVISALAEMNGDITVRLNSGGGFAVDGIAISNALKAHDGNVTVINEGLAASAASIIFMGGDERIMADGALVMIHNASGITFGTAKDHAKGAAELAKLDTQLARIYAKATGMKADKIGAMMDEETWIDADEAIAQGFATGTTDDAASDATAFDYRIYGKAPERLVAMAKTRDWPRITNLTSLPKPGRAPRDAKAALNSKESEMTELEKLAAELKAANEKIAEMTAATDKATATAAASQATADVVTKAKAEFDGERKRCADIAAACSIANLPAKASALIAEGKSLDETMTALQAEKAKQSAEEINTHHRPSEADKVAVNWADVHAAAKAERQKR